MIEETPDGVILTIQIQPKASKTEYMGIHNDSLKFRVAAPPLKGEANKELCHYLAKTFSVSKSSLVIISGPRSRRKRIKLMGVAMHMGMFRSM